MKAIPFAYAIATSAVALVCGAAGGFAQQVTGILGSPEATTTIDGKQLPPPNPPFGGVIKERATESTPWWAPRVVPPKGAPNVLLIMTDDDGFGVPSTFGGVVPSPALDRIANAGLRYTNFHSTLLCSPTRAALITGRNHHVAGFGVVDEIGTGYPGYDSIILKANGTVGEILKENGYGTAWFGKDHNTPSYQATQAGPFNQWPVGMGFEYFYGFVGGDASQWQPNLYLLGEQLTGVAIPVARVAGIAVVGLGFACWPGPPRVGMLIYSALVALYLAYLGAPGGYGGVLLWPAVILHLVFAALLARGSSELWE